MINRISLSQKKLMNMKKIIFLMQLKNKLKIIKRKNKKISQIYKKDRAN